jgi:chemosensory pili system protein ChpA (sensor histidine kinase/response regulator)
MPGPDATLLSWITAEVNQALTVVREHIATFSAEPEDAAVLRGCPDHLHQVSGALRMVGLNGATRFCEAIESSFPGLNGARPTSSALGVIDRAVLALKDFVDGLGRGQPNAPLRLYPVYRELASLQGKPDSSEKELFFPDLSLHAPAHPEPAGLRDDELVLLLQASRAQFQRGVLAWLRRQPAGLDEMAKAVDALHQVARQLPEPRALWWVAGGLVEALQHSRDAEWLAAAKPLANKIDLQMRDLAAGSQAVNDPLLREILYALAKCRPVTPRVKDVWQLYQLESLFPALDVARVEFDMNFLEPVLQDIRARLAALKCAWELYISGEPKSVVRFRELVASFRTKAKDLGNQPLARLLDAIALVSARLPDPCPQHKQYMVIEMAAVFLLVESVIEQFASPPPDLEQQIVIMGGWLLDAAAGKSSGQPPAGLRKDLTQQIGVIQLRAQVAKEISANLKHVEQVLDAFARGAAKRDSLESLAPYLRQIDGALTVLRFERAAEILTTCETMIAACAATGHAREAIDLDWIAEGLSSLGYFLDPCVNGREPSEQALELFFERFASRITPELFAAPAQEAKSTPAPAPARPRADDELLEVYLEEAGEVLAGIEAALPLCRAEPQNRDALTTIRRGFHTLKGSGRMVGLMDLGEVAWELEQVMNLWLEQKRPATPALTELIEAAGKAFSAWVAQLRDGNLAGEIEARALVERARLVKASSAEPADITIGSTTLSPNFHEIYAKEASGHAAALEAECARWRGAPGDDASHEFMRAAHTLGSSSRTAGFPEVAELAGALEEWLPFARQSSAPADAETVQAVVGKLREMTDAVARREAPSVAAAALAQLRELTARLQAPPQPQPEPEPAPQETPAPGVEKRVMRDDIDEQLLPVFLEEAQELVPLIGADLRDWKANPADDQVLQSLRRALHTLKGSARMAGAIRLGELTHIMESRVDAALEAGNFPAELFAELEDKMDRIGLDVERMQGESAGPREGPERKLEEKAGSAEAPLPGAAAMLRVNADTLDHLINGSGEVAIARSRVETELRTVKQALGDLGDSIARLRSQLREVEVQADSQMQSRLSVLEERDREYDPLEFDRYTRLQELTRLMAESLNDVVSIQQGLLKSAGEADAALTQQARTSRDVQQKLMRMRAVPFANLSERLYRIVRQTARELDKKAELEIEGAEVELDRSVLERIGAPLEHLLRNALVHGVEAPAARAAAGKPETGRISLSLRQESNEIALLLADDGAGIDLDTLQRKAIEKGIIAPDQELSEGERVQLVFASGVSTAEAVTQLAGRGVGMDVVRNDISSIGGRIDVATTRGQGTTFTVYLPLTLAVTQAVLVRAGASIFAVSSAMVEQVLRLKADSMAGLHASKAVEFQDRSYPLHSFQHLLATATPVEAHPYASVLLLRSGIQRIALHVDELIGNQEIVVKNIGPQLARVAGVGGATVLADGRIVLIVNPVQLASRARVAPHATQPAQVAAAKPAAPLIMVVDDSLTVRKVASRLLEREGYEVLTAKDGVDALELMKDVLPAVLLIDIEMPRMDGFDLTRNVRGDPRTRDIPIIIISSRTAEKHRNQAASLGVNAFFGKPFPEAELLQCIGSYLRH